MLLISLIKSRHYRALREFLLIVIITGLVALCPAQFAGGSGTADDPWQIETARQLDYVRNYLGSSNSNKHFIQVADVDLGVPGYIEGEGWNPIAYGSCFCGNYNGNGYTISNLYINRPGADYQGLFGELFRARISNIIMINVNVTGNNKVGSLAGSCLSTTFVNNYICSGNVSGNYSIGGITGQSSHSTIINSYCTANVSGVEKVGGLIGGHIYFIGHVLSSYSSGNVSGTSYIGGLIGWCESSVIISDCYNHSTITGYSHVGGLIGISFSSTQVIHSYSTGLINSNIYAGALIGTAQTTFISNSYWDMITSGMTNSAGGGYPRTTAQMTYPYDNETYVEWNFDNIWIEEADYSINNGYPHLRWQTGAAIFLDPDQIELSLLYPDQTYYEVISISNYGSADLVFTIDFTESSEEYFRSRRYVQRLDWLSANPDSGSLAPGETLVIEIAIDTSGIEPLDYTANMIITHNAGSPTLVPISLSVIPYPNFAGGMGTQANPWQIETVEHLNTIRDYLGSGHADKYYIQIADIDLGVSPWNEGEGWEPIGAGDWNDYNPSSLLFFHGYYNGGGHVIDGLYINRPDREHQTGLFGVLRSGRISNLGMTNANVTGTLNVGTVTGINIGTVLNCFSSGIVTGNSNVGGLVGYSSCYWVDYDYAGAASIISRSSSSCNVFGENNIGGIVGRIVVSRVEYCHSTGNVTGTMNRIGGLVGDNFGSIIMNSYSTGNVLGITDVGGLLGRGYGASYWNFGSFSYPSLVEDSFSRGSVSGYQFVGGLIGSNQYHYTPPQPGRVGISLSNNRKTEGDRFPDIDPRDDTAISRFRAYVKNCYSTGLVSGSAVVGGLIGLDMDGTYLNNYWDIEASGMNTSAAGSGRTTAEMTYPYANNTYRDWNFVNTWLADYSSTVNDGYPLLRHPQGQTIEVEPISIYVQLAPEETQTEILTVSNTSVEEVSFDFVIEYFSYSEYMIDGIDFPGETRTKQDRSVTRTDWLSVTPESGTLLYQQELDLALNFNPGNIEGGRYGAHLLIYYGDSYPLTVPIEMIVYYPFDGGEGTADNPWLISTTGQLANLRFSPFLDGYYLQTADIDLGVSPWNEYEGWIPIGRITPFTGHYDGGGHVIVGLTIDNRASYNGLFARTEGAKIINLGVSDVAITLNYASYYVGALVGYADSTIISNCSSTGDIYGSYIRKNGGLVGEVSNGSLIENCFSRVNIDGSQHTGGLVGSSNDSIINNCKSSGNVNGSYYVGGLVGTLENESAIINSSSIGMVIGSLSIYGSTGGLVGYGDNSEIKNCYSRGSVVGGYAGGLVGKLNNESILMNSFSTGFVSNGQFNGGFIASIEGDVFIINSYWDLETSEQTASAGGEGRTTEEMTYPYAPNTFIDWDFVNVWLADEDHLINDGYPYIRENPLSVEDELVIPHSLCFRIYPNPFNPETTIRLVNSQIIPDELIIYNIKGQTVKTFREFEQDREGFYINWNGRDERGRNIASGVYFAVARSAGEILKSGKMLLLK